jgi:hypothetical protein
MNTLRWNMTMHHMHSSNTLDVAVKFEPIFYAQNLTPHMTTQKYTLIISKMVIWGEILEENILNIVLQRWLQHMYAC